MNGFEIINFLVVSGKERKIRKQGKNSVSKIMKSKLIMKLMYQ